MYWAILTGQAWNLQSISQLIRVNTRIATYLCLEISCNDAQPVIQLIDKE